jgi:uncharacterized protein (DUF58 family)
MGKLFSGIIAVIFMAGGLSALTISGASAACDSYTGCADTRCHADNLNNPRVGNPARVRFRVGTPDGNGRPSGKVFFDYERAGSGHFVKEYVRRGYKGNSWDKYAFHNLPRGKYVVKVFFDPRGAYETCKTKFRQTVRPRR